MMIMMMMMNNRTVGAELFHAGGRTERQTGMTKLIGTFYNLANAPKNFTGYKNFLKVCFHEQFKILTNIMKAVW